MNWFDIFLIIVFLFFVWQGFRSGLVGAIGGFIGVVLGIYLGSHYMQIAGEWLMQVANFDNQALANILGFIGIFVLVNVVISIIVWVINKIFHIIPFINLANKLLGALVGVLAGALAIAAIVYLLSLLPFSGAISSSLDNSRFAQMALNIAFVVKPFIPASIEQVKSILENAN